MSRTTSPNRKTKMTDKTPVEKIVDTTLAAVAPASVSPEKAPVDKTVLAFDKPKTTTEVKATYIPEPQHDAPPVVDPLLVTMLCWPRSHNSPEEIAFTGWLENYITTDLKQIVTKRAEGAFSVTIPLDKTQPGTNVFMESTTLFSCHVDTVDNKMVDPTTRKKLTYDPSFGLIALDSQSAGNCLGADDSAGIWLMLKMIAAGTPGTYLFHRGEECSGVSAKAMAKGHKDWLQKFSVAVAFDRKDGGDIVTVQGGLRCASEKFASRLGGMLDAFGFRYKESLTGSYTDVKEYRGIIAEVVNLSCGYDGAHTRKETLDFAHLNALAEALPKVEWESLPIDRDPKAKDPETTTYWKGSRGFANMGSLFDDDEEKQWGARSKAGKKSNGAKTPLAPLEKFEPGNSFSGMTMDEIRDACEDDVQWALEGIVDLMRSNAKLRADIDVLNRLMGL